MRNYTDTLREQAVVVDPDPELTAEREKVIALMMGGPAWDRANPATKIGRFTLMTFYMCVAGPVCWALMGFAFALVLSMSASSKAASDAAFHVGFTASIYATLALVAAFYFGAMRRQLCEPPRLRALPIGEFLSEMKQWQQASEQAAESSRCEHARFIAQIDARENADYLADRVGQESLRTGRMLEMEKHMRTYPS